MWSPRSATDCDCLYYEDETLCKICRNDITPEEEEQERKDQLELDEEENAE